MFDLFKSEFLSFAKRGGKIEIVCSNQVVMEDYEVAANVALVPRLHNIEEQIDFEIQKLEQEQKSLDALAFFATLISVGALKIKVASLKAGGIFHDKTGVFTDEVGHSVSFRGSSNETLMGWAKRGNFETLEVFSSWDPRDEERVANHINYLDALWNGNVPDLEVCPLSEVALDKIQQRSREDIDEFALVFEKYENGAGATGSSAENDHSNQNKRELMPFQRSTLDNWEANNFQGIIKHATGSGKTVTAINAIAEHLTSGAAVVVVVPSRLLLRQWYSEIRKDLPNCSILRCGDGHTSWRDSATFRSYLRLRDDMPGTVILTTAHTMSSPNFLSNLRNLHSVLLVADEVHTLGSTQNKVVLDYGFGKRLGLSATPERYGDEDGTRAILEYFAGVVEPVITIFDAIKEGRLVNYVYYPKAVFLDDEEMGEWREFTRRLISAGIQRDAKTQSKEKKELVKRLLIQRSRIAKKAKGKLPVAVDLILNHFQSGEYWLVYCEDMDQLEELNNRLRHQRYSPYIYATGLDGYPEAELKDYIQRGGIMLSIRCLDEGVDIPRISHVVILASSQNPRQFIQRRGRVLRVDGIKSKASIYDLFALPNETHANEGASLVASEVIRGTEFAKYALNKETALMALRKFMIDLNINPDEVSYMDGIEGEEVLDEQ